MTHKESEMNDGKDMQERAGPGRETPRRRAPSKAV